MKSLNIKISTIAAICLISASSICSAQDANISINQDAKIDKLLELKKGMNKETTDRYKIQIYSGNRSAAQNAKEKFLSKYSNWSPSMVFETPNYKIWAGNFRSRLEADRALKKIKKNFSGAFIFKPKKK
ncbi:hypothetical protein GCM10022291_15430 [Postechiella marina]|uniref:SPOR domain-containing protein n=1 Tax=Postechiella marina TaxID=943941 RepID=A0ABP8C751_9FLAO